MDDSRKSNAVERRFRARYPIKLGVRFRTLGRNPVAGVGESVNFSSTGIFVAVQQQPQVNVGSLLQAIVEWPIKLHGTTSLHLVAAGRVVRSVTAGFALAIEHHEFRTAKSEPASVSGGKSRHRTSG
jgi:hypothetical protein